MHFNILDHLTVDKLVKTKRDDLNDPPYIHRSASPYVGRKQSPREDQGLRSKSGNNL